jgi:hypothetical protein
MSCFVFWLEPALSGVVFPDFFSVHLCQQEDRILKTMLTASCPMYPDLPCILISANMTTCMNEATARDNTFTNPYSFFFN